MPLARRAENIGLPDRWVWKHGAIYYIVPEGAEKLWDFKTWFRLGKTIEEARATWEARVAQTVEADQPDLPNVFALQKRTLVLEGVYLLHKGDEIVYVGRSDNVPNRVASHIGRYAFDIYSVVPASGLEQHRLEQILIAKLKPRHNTNCLRLIGEFDTNR